MTDLYNLKIRIDSSDIVAAVDALNDLTKAAREARVAIEALGHVNRRTIPLVDGVWVDVAGDSSSANPSTEPMA